MKKILTLLFLLFSLPAHAVSVTLQQGVDCGDLCDGNYTGTADSYTYHVLDENRDTDGLILPFPFSGHVKRNFIKYDFSPIQSYCPGGVDVTSASLTIRIKSGLSNDNCSTHVRRVLRNWTETGVTSATYNGTDSWTSEDGTGEGTDITASDDGSNTRTGISAPVTITVSSLETLVEGWINGTYSNYGMSVYSDAEGDAEGIAGDSEDATSSNRPALTIDFTCLEESGGGVWYGTFNGVLN